MRCLPLHSRPPVRARRRIPLLAGLLALCGCDATENIDTVSVSLANESATAVHLLTAGEDFSPSNRVEPGMGRTRSISIRVDQVEMQDFRAGRNGTVVATVSCFYHTNLVVVFNANETMSCD